MRISLAIIFFFITLISRSQSPVEKYFNQVRNNTAKLTAFMSQMPKGGDLHHHFGGSVYAEPLLNIAIKEDFYLNIKTLFVAREIPKDDTGGKWVKFSVLEKNKELNEYKIKILSRWSVKDYDPSHYPSDKLFFESFEKFDEVMDDRHQFAAGMLEVKNRAVKENVSYLETQLAQVKYFIDSKDLDYYNEVLHQLAEKRDEAGIDKILENLYNSFISRKAEAQAEEFNRNVVQKLHDSLKIDDDNFTMRYQNFVLRFKQPVNLFKDLVLSFISASKSDLIVGVNIVSPEDGETSMHDYWLHMIMYKFCHNKFPAVKYSMHAGELTLGLVQPEELTWHISEAVKTAGAQRIGHGVDIAYEQNCYELLKYMSKNKIAVEINLTSNEFILKVKEDKHPLELYQSFGVPVVICTDDMAILRSNHTDQFVLLAKRYPSITYSQIKSFVFNSIEYSLIKEESVRKKIKTNLEQRFKKFEALFPLK